MENGSVFANWQFVLSMQALLIKYYTTKSLSIEPISSHTLFIISCVFLRLAKLKFSFFPILFVCFVHRGWKYKKRECRRKWCQNTLCVHMNRVRVFFNGYDFFCIEKRFIHLLCSTRRHKTFMFRVLHIFLQIRRFIALYSGFHCCCCSDCFLHRQNVRLLFSSPSGCVIFDFNSLHFDVFPFFPCFMPLICPLKVFFVRTACAIVRMCVWMYWIPFFTWKFLNIWIISTIRSQQLFH